MNILLRCEIRAHLPCVLCPGSRNKKVMKGRLLQEFQRRVICTKAILRHSDVEVTMVKTDFEWLRWVISGWSSNRACLWFSVDEIVTQEQLIGGQIIWSVIVLKQNIPLFETNSNGLQNRIIYGQIWIWMRIQRRFYKTFCKHNFLISVHLILINDNYIFT